MTIAEASRLLQRGEVSSEELVRESLRRIERLNPTLNAFITVTGEAALERARQLDLKRASGGPCGSLCGIPIGLKDVFCTRGVRTTCGSKFYAEYVPDFDSAVAEKLEAVDAVLIGKTGLHEFAYGITSDNPHFGTIRNPWDPERIPGGSSGGSGVAVSAGMVLAAMGTDTGGSIRLPAAYCGTVGFKPTSGRVSRYGVLPLDFSLDHMGPLTRSVEDAALLMNVLAGHDERDDTSSQVASEDYNLNGRHSLDGLRIGRPENFFFERADPGVIAACDKALLEAEELGAEVVPVRLPDPAELNVIGRVILLCEASAVLGKFLAQRQGLGDDLRLLVEQGMLLPATDYINAQRVRRKLQADFASVWKSVDCLITPAAPITAPKIGQASVLIGGEAEDTRMASTRYARPFNVLGWPAIVFPCGRSSSGLPIGLQIIGRPFQERQLLLVASSIEHSLHYADQTPPGVEGSLI